MLQIKVLEQNEMHLDKLCMSKIQFLGKLHLKCSFHTKIVFVQFTRKDHDSNQTAISL